MRNARLLSLAIAILVICSSLTWSVPPAISSPLYVEPALLATERETVPVIVTGASVPVVSRARAKNDTKLCNSNQHKL